MRPSIRSPKRKTLVLRGLAAVAAVVAVLGLVVADAGAAANTPPATPVITEPSVDSQIVHPAGVHMESSLFSDVDAGQTHV
jgi:hypothetical protein